MGATHKSTRMWNQVHAGAASHLSLAVSGHTTVVPPPGGDSKIRTVPEVKEKDLLLLATSP